MAALVAATAMSAADKALSVSLDGDTIVGEGIDANKLRQAAIWQGGTECGCWGRSSPIPGRATTS
jgi:hypothetical protein